MTCTNWSSAHQFAAPTATQALLAGNNGAHIINDLVPNNNYLCYNTASSNTSSYNNFDFNPYTPFTNYVNDVNNSSYGKVINAGMKQSILNTLANGNIYSNAAGVLGITSIFCNMFCGLSNGISNWAEGRTTSQYSNLC